MEESRNSKSYRPDESGWGKGLLEKELSVDRKRRGGIPRCLNCTVHRLTHSYINSVQ